ncbi:hypothetical protein [Klebsiella pneumoniae]|uniref:hypothetical protein n=1 Tax=Klebsiella pneumoniae TaxID=573 RepID=UPI00203B0481|nr:hypothetical protein [Klebsiella pneumoniae]USB65890.1 hypothetical protein KU669_03230 [Klebsiella pneumoniae]
MSDGTDQKTARRTAHESFWKVGGIRMAFVSIINGGGRGRKRTTSGISIKYSKSGSMQCYVGVDIRANNRFIFVEIDEETRQIRVMSTGDENGAKMSGVSGGSFSVTKKLGDVVIPLGHKKTFIALKKESDGWWYGEYQAEGANQ